MYWAVLWQLSNGQQYLGQWHCDPDDLPQYIKVNRGGWFIKPLAIIRCRAKDNI